MNAFSIGQVAQRAGVAASTIRYYEQIGLLPEPARCSGRRQYGPDVLWRLALIQESKQSGFSLGEIRRLLDGFPAGTAPPDRWQNLAGRKLTEIDRQIAELERARDRLTRMLNCQCGSLAECATA